MTPTLLQRCAAVFNNREVYAESHGEASASVPSSNALLKLVTAVLIGSTLAMSGQAMAADAHAGAFRADIQNAQSQMDRAERSGGMKSSESGEERFQITKMKVEAGVLQYMEFKGELPSIEACKPFAGMTIDAAHAYSNSYFERHNVTSLSMRMDITNYVADHAAACNYAVLPGASGPDIASR